MEGGWPRVGTEGGGMPEDGEGSQRLSADWYSPAGKGVGEGEGGGGGGGWNGWGRVQGCMEGEHRGDGGSLMVESAAGFRAVNATVISPVHPKTVSASRCSGFPSFW